MPTPITGHDQRADDGVEQAALVRSGWRCVLGEQLDIEASQAVVEQRDQDQRKPGDAEGGRGDAEPADDEVLAAAA
ncbi:hypothetical protein ACVWZZ_005063 [Bradyrhizobium sp. LM6.10]